MRGLFKKTAFFFLATFTCATPFCVNAQAKDSLLSLFRPVIQRWTFETRDLDSLPPVGKDGLIYALQVSGIVVAVRSEDGQLIWRSETGGEFSAAPTVGQHEMYVASELGNSSQNGTSETLGGVIRALSMTTGVVLWTRTVPSPIVGTLVISDGLLFGASKDGRIYALDSKTGVPVWIKPLQHSFSSTPLIQNEKIYLASDDGFLIALEMRTGAALWRYRTDSSNRPLFAVMQRTIYLGDASGYVSALHETGVGLRALWRKRAGTSIQTLSLTQNGLVVTSLDNFVYFLSYRKGERLWKKQMPGRILLQPLIVTGSALFAPLGGEECVALSLADGKQINTIPLGAGNSTIASPLIADSLLIIPTRQGLLAFVPSDVTKQ